MRGHGGLQDSRNEIDTDCRDAELDRRDGRCGRRRRCRRVTDCLTNLTRDTVGVQRQIGHVRDADRLRNGKQKQARTDGASPTAEVLSGQSDHCGSLALIFADGNSLRTYTIERQCSMRRIAIL